MKPIQRIDLLQEVADAARLVVTYGSGHMFDLKQSMAKLDASEPVTVEQVVVEVGKVFTGTTRYENEQHARAVMRALGATDE